VIDPTRIGLNHEAAVERCYTGDAVGWMSEWRRRPSVDELKSALKLALLDLEADNDWRS